MEYCTPLGQWCIPLRFTAKRIPKANGVGYSLSSMLGDWVHALTLRICMSPVACATQLKHTIAYVDVGRQRFSAAQLEEHQKDVLMPQQLAMRQQARTLACTSGTPAHWCLELPFFLRGWHQGTCDCYPLDVHVEFGTHGFCDVDLLVHSVMFTNREHVLTLTEPERNCWATEGWSSALAPDCLHTSCSWIASLFFGNSGIATGIMSTVLNGLLKREGEDSGTLEHMKVFAQPADEQAGATTNTAYTALNFRLPFTVIRRMALRGVHARDIHSVALLSSRGAVVEEMPGTYIAIVNRDSQVGDDCALPFLARVLPWPGRSQVCDLPPHDYTLCVRLHNKHGCAPGWIENMPSLVLHARVPTIKPGKLTHREYTIARRVCASAAQLPLALQAGMQHTVHVSLPAALAGLVLQMPNGWALKSVNLGTGNNGDDDILTWPATRIVDHMAVCGIENALATAASGTYILHTPMMFNTNMTLRIVCTTLCTTHAAVVADTCLQVFLHTLNVACTADKMFTWAYK